jgi:hypothetical protein
MIDDLHRMYSSPNALPPHQRHSDTSRAAAIAAKNNFGTKAAELLMHFFDEAAGITDEEGQDKYSIPGNSYRPMRVVLMNLGLVRDSGVRRLTRAKRISVVWKITPDGMAVYNGQKNIADLAEDVKKNKKPSVSKEKADLKAEIMRLRLEMERIADLSEMWADSLVSQINKIARDALDGRHD